MQGLVDLQSPINWDAPHNKGLRAWWSALPGRMSGNVLRDLTRRYDAPINGATPAAGKMHRGGYGCLSFDGVNDGAQTTNTLNLSSVNTLSVAAWFFESVMDGGNDVVIESSNDSSASGGGANVGSFFIIPDRTGTNRFSVRLRVGTGAADYNEYECTRPAAATWHYITVTMDRNGGAQQVLAIYINGVSQSLTTINSNTGSSGGFGNFVWNFGSRANGTNLQNACRLNDIRVHDRILSAPQALDSYRRAMQGWREEWNWLRAPLLAGEQAAGAAARASNLSLMGVG